VTPTEVEQAIERTGAKYVADMASLYDRISAELGKVYEGQLATKDQALAAHALTIAELRRRAEVTEAEVARQKAAEDKRIDAAAEWQRANNAALGVQRAGSMLRPNLEKVADRLDAAKAVPPIDQPGQQRTIWERVLARLRGEW